MSTFNFDTFKRKLQYKIQDMKDNLNMNKYLEDAFDDLHRYVFSNVNELNTALDKATGNSWSEVCDFEGGNHICDLKANHDESRVGDHVFVSKDLLKMSVASFMHLLKLNKWLQVESGSYTFVKGDRTISIHGKKTVSVSIAIDTQIFMVCQFSLDDIVKVDMQSDYIEARDINDNYALHYIRL